MLSTAHHTSIPLIEFHNVHKSYGQVHVLQGLTLKIQAKEQCAIRGASGSGKSTFVYLLGGLEKAGRGEIRVGDKKLGQMGDEDLAHYRNRFVGFVFQFHFLLPSMTCWKNLLLPAQIGRKSLEEVQERIKTMAHTLGVQHCLDKYPYQLSGGEQQRINIIRALSLNPPLLLCDEPTGNLDSYNSSRVTGLLKELASEFGATLLVVTHDDKVASEFSREIHITDGKIA